MGIFDLFTADKRADEITRAFIGAYAVSRMDDDQRQVIMFQVYRMLCESGPFRLSFDEANEKFNTSSAIVQAGLMVNAMISLGIHHGVPGFQWDYIPNPFVLSRPSEKVGRIVISNLSKYGLDPDKCFAGSKEI